MDKTEKNTGKIREKNGKFAKGNQEGNRNGRPRKDHAITDIANRLLDTPIGDITTREYIISTVIEMAKKGDRWAIEFLAERTEGKALERVETKEVKDEVVIE